MPNLTTPDQWVLEVRDINGSSYFTTVLDSFVDVKALTDKIERAGFVAHSHKTSSPGTVESWLQQLGEHHE